MVSEDKIKLMTRIAAFEENHKEALKADRYFAADYIGLSLLRAFAAYTVLYGLAALMWLLYHCEALISEGNIEKIFDLAGRIGLTWLILLVPLALVVYLISRARYESFKGELLEYHKVLKELDDYYQNEEKADRGGTAI